MIVGLPTEKMGIITVTFSLDDKLPESKVFNVGDILDIIWAFPVNEQRRNRTLKNIWSKVFKNRPSKICGRQPLINLKGYDLL